jgi:hypothetical protein
MYTSDIKGLQHLHQTICDTAERAIAEQASRQSRNDATIKLIDRLTNTCEAISTRLDAFITRQEQEREAKAREDEAARTEAYLQSLPDADAPGTPPGQSSDDDLIQAPGANLQPQPPINEEKNDPLGMGDTSSGDPSPRDAATGVLPKELDIPLGGASEPVDDPAALENPQLSETKYRNPAEVSLW